MLLRMNNKHNGWITVLTHHFRTNYFNFVTVCLSIVLLCRGQCPSGSVTFEKIAGVTVQGIRFVPFYKGYQSQPAITYECLTACRVTDDCRSLQLSYIATNCMKSGMSSEGRRTDITMTAPPSSTSFFEKICLTGPRCPRLWAFERVIGFELSGFDDRSIPGVTSRLQCQELCLREKGFFCRSGEYDYSFQQCRLSSEDRRSQPSSFRPAFGDVDYFENQCMPEGSLRCNYELMEDSETDRTDKTVTTYSETQCEEKCDNSEHFLCQSFSYRPSTGQCSLSTDDTFNLGQSVIRKRRGSAYYQKSNCLDLKLSCSSEAMQLVLNTREPFNGRIYALHHPYTCQVYGDQQTVTVFTMTTNENCGLEMELDGHLTNAIVIQYHPLIQQKGDRIIKLYCALFEDANKTITRSLSVGPGPDQSATSVVNATAPTPNIRLRITNINGTAVTDTKIGDPLYFRIEIDDDSAFGIFARNLTARSGSQDKIITLMDEDGCPTDPKLFPDFERVPNSKSLQSRFLAFKFPDDAVVRFEVNVHFCLQECSSVVCHGGTTSLGRKKREIATTLPIVPDYPLVTAIRVEGSRTDNNTDENPESLGYQNVPSGELVCTTKIVVVVSALGALFLQIGLLAACATCLLLSRRETKTRYKEDAASTITETLPPFSSEISHRRLR